LRRTVAALGGDVRAVLAFSTAHRMLGVADERVSVYYAKDDFTAGTELLGGDADAAQRSELWAAEHADVVIAHSPPLMERWRAYDPVFVPNGVDAEFYAGEVAPAVDVDLPRPVAGFVGHLSERIDLALLDTIAWRGTSLLLVGPRQATYDLRRLGPLLERPNVRWIGGRPYDDLPRYMQAIDVGIVPYTHSAFNQASFPLKVLEYLAAGRSVVATDLPAIRWLDTDLVAVADEPEAFADAVDAAAATARDAALVARRRELARAHDWSGRVETIARAIGLV
jgi:teichuronic acid biosynthesis glycosyltransferase TuaH